MDRHGLRPRDDARGVVTGCGLAMTNVPVIASETLLGDPSMAKQKLGSPIFSFTKN